MNGPANMGMTLQGCFHITILHIINLSRSHCIAAVLSLPLVKLKLKLLLLGFMMLF